jgi:hypothetical protein
VEHYLHIAYAADRLLNPVRDPITLPPPAPEVRPEQHDDHDAALAWFTAEHQVLLGTLDLAPPAHAWRLAWSLTTFLDRQGHWRGDVQLAAGHRDEAHDAWRRALVILDDLDHPDAEQVRDKLGA